MKRLNLKKILGKNEIITPPIDPPRTKTNVHINRLAINCPSGKVTYGNVEDAIKAQLLIKKKSHNAHCYWYKCEDCGHFHLSSKPNHRKRKH